ncbi:pyridoxal phosphate-dependent transferase [Lasiosphaeria ovina]|uniref:Pyridoxal phosphate-dependent transferase n=1 Tax=Lasiosphaeria ovina TaxID=92902 RepID=A0AAE0NDV5_9PEZI|nr:pyridoxal phosphate-dependent transferase [Lasiosphaeria ovina]
MLGQHSVPFWSPRYQAHMCTDLSMPALLGYFMTMIYNPNNVALEASPITSVAEMEVGEQLCELFGFKTKPANANDPTPWAHITCDGTVANLESMWVARNLKYYPLSLRKAMDDADGPLRFVPDAFSVRTCQGRLKPFRELSAWELLNLKLKTILDMPARLYSEYGITPTWLQDALDGYNIQTVGKDLLDQHYKIGAKNTRYFVSGSKHYSWPKAAALTGLGSDSVVNVNLDVNGRIDVDKLEAQLEKSLKEEQAVLAVVAVVGSTEEGAVDPLRKIVALRQRFQALGLSFMVHADSAWGGYFATMLPRDDDDDDDDPRAAMPGRDLGDGGTDGLVPDLSLRVETQEDLFALRYCDSITVDPHKAGYVPYPAGALAYRDGRIKNLVTWTAPYLSRGAEGDANMGIYGVEGSTDFSALWAALSLPSDDFVCVPFNMLPSEATGRAEAVEEEKQRIRDEILGKTNAQIVSGDRGRKPGDKTMALLRALGSDLNINLFALNWRYPDGRLNTDVDEANYLMSRVIQRLSVDSPDDKTTAIPLYLTSAELEPQVYGGGCLENFKARLGLEHDTRESLLVFRNVVMSPLASFSTRGGFINMLGDTLKAVVAEEVCQKRNEDGPDYHSFWVHGTEDVFLSYRPMLNIAKHRQQVILGVELDAAGARAYRQLAGNTEDEIVLKTSHKIDLAGLLAVFQNGQGQDDDVVFRGNLATRSHGVVAAHVRVRVTRVVKNRPLNRGAQDDAYPSGFTPFYLYGTAAEQHMDHMLVQSPNISLSAGSVALALSDNGGGADAISAALASDNGAIVTLDDVHEAAMQPFSPESLERPSFFFRPGQSFRVSVWRDPRGVNESARNMLADLRQAQKQPLAAGTLTLGDDVVVDVDKTNRDPFRDSGDAKVGRWRERFRTVGRGI